MFYQGQRNKRIHIPFFICMLLCLLTSCSAQDRSNIRAVLDARDTAVSSHDIRSYAALLMPGYQHHEQTEFEIINRMRKLFAQFEQIEMTSANRTIRLLDHNRAECEQSYLLRVQANGAWRQINQRERIILSKTETGWKISGGL